MHHRDQPVKEMQDGIKPVETGRMPYDNFIPVLNVGIICMKIQEIITGDRIHSEGMFARVYDFALHVIVCMWFGLIAMIEDVF